LAFEIAPVILDWNRTSQGAFCSFVPREGRIMNHDNRFAVALGQAVIAAWGELPPDVQHRLFEDAVIAGHHTERDESLREQLAAFLHRHHPRTQR
jgi:hypothetical protein